MQLSILWSGSKYLPAKSKRIIQALRNGIPLTGRNPEASDKSELLGKWRFCKDLGVQSDNGLILVVDLFLHLPRQLFILHFILSDLAGWEKRKVNEKKEVKDVGGGP